jgi:uncharacterized heparinase superfamily protein
MTGIGTLWRTVRHLKAQQIVGRVRYRIQRPVPDLRPPPPLRAPSGHWVTPAQRQPSMRGPSQWHVLGTDHDLARSGWDDPRVDRLLRYNLHYFDDLNAAGAASRREWHRALLDRWITENPPGTGTGWEPYPLSLRLVNWIKWFRAGETPRPEWLASAAIQARWLTQRLEFHLLGNHLFANAKALVFAGLFFEGAEADAWLQRGADILSRELPEQILADGGHFERSPMYHALALEDVLDLINLGFRRETLAEVAARMLFWLRCLSHRDASLAHFNDVAQGIAPSLAELEQYADRLGIRAAQPLAEGITHLAPSGYVRAARGAALVLLDVAPVGPDYLPGHAHADTLSFELSIAGRRIVVNGGTSCYGTVSQRFKERGTALHSTVEVGGADSSEVWSSFRVGRRARVLAVDVADWTVSAAHDGYRFLPGRPVHRRSWRLEVDALVVEDHVQPAQHAATARYILAPGLQLLEKGAGKWAITEGGAQLAAVEVTRGEARVEPATYGPDFGVVLSTHCLAIALRDGRAVTRWTWS